MSRTRRDDVFEQSRQQHLLTVGFLTTLKNHFDSKTAFQLACDSFNTYMIQYYQHVMRGTKLGSQQRFNAFRKHYEQYAKKTTYCHIIASTSTVLKVRYDRCPFHELMNAYDLSMFTYAFCLSDHAFTKVVLPGVTFRRQSVIAKGKLFCNHTWIYKKTKVLGKSSVKRLKKK